MTTTPDTDMRPERSEMDDDVTIYISIESKSKGQQLTVEGPLALWRELLLSLNLQRIEYAGGFDPATPDPGDEGKVG